ncbi:hypothetical protein H6G00_33310 [Leptolyngbya sp. FACHB-541]|uniref:hypothetical protein n=1 Tax=Leptolyngbya sp. FACHB-541 TaxID=2692810 RepID=UPI00168379CA|nr:hypothetical protein [Leptolyngbya sp. FACHB-541]MBD2001420.1 hypothetical protein [Leptolyngbya sp. FACHB-541]
MSKPLHPSLPLSLPEGFPKSTQVPKFSLGDRVQWHPLPSRDFGTITGLLYAPTQQTQSWQWQYTVWLDPQSPSRIWTQSDVAWEEDLELLGAESTNPIVKGNPS